MSSATEKTRFIYHRPVKDEEREDENNSHDFDLEIDDNFDAGGDPYNSTGQHVILKPKYPE